MTVPARTPGTGEQPGVAAPGVALVAAPSRAELVDGAVATWRAALVAEAGGSARSDIDLLAEAALDLSAAHPSGMAQLFAGRPTRLSNLVREGAALSLARRRARAVAARASVSAQRYGIAPTSLAIGVATWTEPTWPEVSHDDVGALAAATSHGQRGYDGGSDLVAGARTVRVPVLLRPVTVAARGSAESDYELTLEPEVQVNPVLVRALRSRGALLDPVSLAEGTYASGAFDPRAALARLSSLGEAVLADFELVDRRVVGAFVHPGQGLVDDLDTLAASLADHELVAALAGDDQAQAALAVELPSPLLIDRDPALERGVGDLDAAQRYVLDAVETGAHLFVDAPAGSDVTGTIAAVVAHAAAAGLTVLYVPGSRGGSLALAERLTALGLGDLLLDVPPEAGWRQTVARRLLGAMTLDAPVVDPDDRRRLHGQVGELRDQLAAYVQALHTPRAPWDVSAYDALQQLARLTAQRPTPRTAARLTPDAARVLDAERRAELGADLRRAAELGAFTVRPQDTLWFGADLRTDSDATVALRRVERLVTSTLPTLVARARQVAEETGLTPAASLGAWAEQLEMLGQVRASLDVFTPIVFERSPADMVAATATKAWRAEHGVDMGFWLRRRLRKQAHDLVRPGRPVADLHAALRDVEVRRDVWRAHCPAGGWPRLPDSFDLVEADYAAVRGDVEALEAVLPQVGARLSALPLDELTTRLRRLLDGASALDGLPERTVLLARARACGLEPLVADLHRRRVAPDVAPAELELAWWSTVFEQILAADPALAGYDGAALEALSDRFAAADREHVQSLPPVVLGDVVATVQGRLRQYRDQAEALFVELVEENLLSVRDAAQRYPDVARHLRPVLAVSPMLVPQVAPPLRQVDLVVLDAAGHLPTQMAVPALARGRQVVVVGDARCASSTAVRELAEILPTIALRAEGARRDPYLTAFLAEHGYAGVLRPVPLPDATPLVHLHEVDGTGMPDAAAGLVDSTRAEVDQVVELVLEHALTRPEESLAVVTVTARHADAVRDAVLSEVRGAPALAAFFDSGRPEPFVVVDLPNVAGLRRDAVLLSLGLGRTPHRRVLHSFGPLSTPGGDALLLDALGSVRHRFDLVSCFGADDLDPERLRGPGPRLLADLLDFARRRGAGEVEVAAANVGDDAGAPTLDADRLLLDVAERLWKHGLNVELDHGLPGGVRIPMVVGHPAIPGRFVVAVLTDDDAYVNEPSVRARDRLAADRLESLGWTVVRVWSVAAFLDPQAEVDRVRRAVHAQLPSQLDMPVTRPVPVLTENLTPAAGVESPVPAADLPMADLPVAELPVADQPVVAPSVVGDPAAEEPVADEWVADPPLDDARTAPTPSDEVKAPSAPADEVTSPAPADEVKRPAPADEAAAPHPRQLALALPSVPRPDVRQGLPIGAYSDDQLDDLVAWIRSDGQERTRDGLADELRAALGITRRGHRVDTAVRAAVVRALSPAEPR
ncbi:MAG: hypothetical protein KJ548_05685 [Actinobacteria bacterium]|nr:hypothetical protein [Actinomycetota bacterium]